MSTSMRNFGAVAMRAFLSRSVAALVGGYALSDLVDGLCEERCFRLILLVTKFCFQSRELSFDILFGLSLANDLFSITAQEVVDGFDTDLDRPGRFVFVQILKAKIRRPRLLDDAFDHTIDWRIVPALEAGDLERNQVRMARRELRSPNLVIGAARIRVLPGITNIQRTADHACANFFPKKAVQQILVQRKSVLREDRISKLLELVQDLMVESRIVVIRSAEHDNSNAVLVFKLVNYSPGPPANARLIVPESVESAFDCSIVFLL